MVDRAAVGMSVRRAVRGRSILYSSRRLLPAIVSSVWSLILSAPLACTASLAWNVLGSRATVNASASQRRATTYVRGRNLALIVSVGRTGSPSHLRFVCLKQRVLGHTPALPAVLLCDAAGVLAGRLGHKGGSGLLLPSLRRGDALGVLFTLRPLLLFSSCCLAKNASRRLNTAPGYRRLSIESPLVLNITYMPFVGAASSRRDCDVCAFAAIRIPLWLFKGGDQVSATMAWRAFMGRAGGLVARRSAAFHLLTPCMAAWLLRAARRCGHTCGRPLLPRLRLRRTTAVPGWRLCWCRALCLTAAERQSAGRTWTRLVW